MVYLTEFSTFEATILIAMKKKILWAILALLVLIQFIRIDKDNPEADPAQDFIQVMSPPAAVADRLKASCYDCHSHHSRYPWYTNIAPVSWWIKGHINEAREHLNFSIWTTYEPDKAAHKLEECYEEVEEEHMPLRSYLWMHPEARLTDEQRREMVEWFKQAQVASE